LQADYTRDLLTLAFSHPSVTAIMIWGFWEGRHWKPDAALWRRDWSIKPNGKVWTDLIMREWHSAGESVTDADGWISFRGFHGIYQIDAGTGASHQVSLDKSRPSAVVHSHPTPN
jgi:endo-1,4-beta-xylanase